MNYFNYKFNSLELGPSVIPHVAQFYPTLLKALQNSEKSKSAKSRALIRISILSSLEVIISQIAQFLSPYLSQTLNTLIEPKLLTNETKNEQVILFKFFFLKLKF